MSRSAEENGFRYDYNESGRTLGLKIIDSFVNCRVVIVGLNSLDIPVAGSLRGI